MQISYGGEGRPQQTPYEAIGGAGTVARLVEAFYKRGGRASGPAPIFPDDLGPVAKKQYAFLTQFFGGPPLFSQEYGPPMLRMRHLPHPITPRRAEAWLECMAGAPGRSRRQGTRARLFVAAPQPDGLSHGEYGKPRGAGG